VIAFEVSTFIARPVEAVFVFVSNLENNPQWQAVTVEATKSSEGPIGVGTTWKETVRLLGRQIEVERRTTAYEPNSGFSLATTSGPVQVEATIRLEPENGGTRFSAAFRGDAGALAKLGGPLLATMMKRGVEADVATLKALLESAASDMP
jgi:carbon monoxide dehydrogenase subunit G